MELVRAGIGDGIDLMIDELFDLEFRDRQVTGPIRSSALPLDPA